MSIIESTCHVDYFHRLLSLGISHAGCLFCSLPVCIMMVYSIISTVEVVSAIISLCLAYNAVARNPTHIGTYLRLHALSCVIIL